MKVDPNIAASIATQSKLMKAARGGDSVISDEKFAEICVAVQNGEITFREAYKIINDLILPLSQSSAASGSEPE